MRALAALVTCLASLGAGAGCHLTAALTYPSADDGDAENVVALGAIAYAAMAERGLALVDLASGAVLRVVPPPQSTCAIDDVALADGWLFALDARDGALSVWSLADPAHPALVSGPVAVPVGPFSGVSAGGGRVVVSGGTSELTVWSYDMAGELGAHAALEVARGQPDVLVAPDGARAFVSTHFETTRFGLTILALGTPPETPRIVGRLELPGAGFTEGGSKPASFPLNAALHRDRLVLVHGRGLTLIELADPSAPKVVATLALGLEAVHVAIDGDVAIVVGAGPEPALVVVDLAAHDVPKVVRTLPLPGPATGVALAGEHIALAAGKNGVLVLPR